MRSVQKLKSHRANKQMYKRKLENKLQQNNVKDHRLQEEEDQTDGSLDRENELNTFFNRFSCLTH